MKYLMIFAAGVLVGAAGLFHAAQTDFANITAALGMQPVQAVQPVLPVLPIQAAQPLPARITAPVALTVPVPAPAPAVEARSADAIGPAPAAVAPEALEESALAAYPGGLLIPVQGIAAEHLRNTFEEARGSGRSHEAIDIAAPTGTPVLAVDDGPLVKLFDSARGGLTVYQFDRHGRFAYYYAHLDSYAAGLAEGQPLRRGELIGYVGASGNADPLAPHLHFAVFVLGAEKNWWQGAAINPYPLFEREGRGDARLSFAASARVDR